MGEPNIRTMGDTNDENAQAATGNVCTAAIDFSQFFPGSQFRVAQTRKGCFQELCGCDANEEFKFIVDGKHTAMIAEHSTCCMRFCCGGNRPWTTDMYVPEVPGSQPVVPANVDNGEAPKGVLTFTRPFRCNMGNCKCCCYQQVMVDHYGQPLGGVIETCWYCVPNFHTYKGVDGQDPEYQIHMPTCCGGMCVNVCAEGCCNCRIPFYMYPIGGGDDDSLDCDASVPKTHDKQEGATKAQICKIWNGLGNELFTDADTFEVLVPQQSANDASSKARLIASTLIINQLFFERQQGDGAAGA